MRMAGVPEASIDYWIAKFLGQGYKVKGGSLPALRILAHADVLSAGL